VAVAVVVAVRFVKRNAVGEVELFLRKRPAGGLLAGMWEFPGVELGKPQDDQLAREAAVRLAEGLGLGFRAGGPEVEVRELAEVLHVFSHLKVRYHPFLYPSGGGGEGSGSWYRQEALRDVPLPVAQQKMAEAALDYLKEMEDGG
jgi:A/G-specific adenine glycosylase